MIQIVTAISGARGRLVGEPELIANLAATLACNEHGSDRIGEVIKPYITEAVAAENLNFLPVQDKPVVLNVKGASAAGRSTMRPLQKTLTERLGIPWEDFALVSPDIWRKFLLDYDSLWRKFLLDYDSLGPAYKYAGTLTGHELEIIDRKLDRYMACKARDGRMSHLLIDRFRFDSFVPESDTSEDSKLLTRFGDLVFMFFVITPPDATVERAWQRGLKFGRYKAVDDLLDHNVEAFTGMPNLSFTWALRTHKLTGIVEADETCVPESRKGARNLERKARRRGGKASKRGLSDEQVPVLVVADRSGATVSAVLPAVNADTLREVIAPVVDEDIVWLSLQAVCVHVMFFVKSEGWIDMDHKQFQEWLSGPDHLSPAQRQQTEAVFPGTRRRQRRWLPLKRPWVKIASARIVARQAPYRVARQGVCDGTSARDAGRHSMPRPAPPCRVCTARTSGFPSEPVLLMG